MLLLNSVSLILHLGRLGFAKVQAINFEEFAQLLEHRLDLRLIRDVAHFWLLEKAKDPDDVFV